MSDPLHQIDQEEATVRQYYDELAVDYDSDRFGNSYGTYLDRQERLVLQHWLKPFQNQAVLDLACGTGRFLDLATAGLDISPTMLEVARAKYPDKTLILGSASQMAIAPSSYDAVFAVHLFMHLSQAKIQTVLQDCYRILKPNGTLIFDIPSALRRRLISYRAESWHGATALSPADLQQLCADRWQILNTVGVAFFPVHRIPVQLRGKLVPIDNFLGRSPIKHLASYQMIQLKKL